MLKPLFGFLSDYLHLCGYRIKSYAILCCLIQISVCLIFIFTLPSFAVFFTCFVFKNIATSCLDSISDGMAAVLAKLDKRIGLLEESLRDKSKGKGVI